jgi:hypothetical protein
MHDRPTYLELIDAVRHFLEHDAVPALEGTRKFHARVAANVLAIVGRELRSETAHLRAEWARLDALLGPAPLPAEAESLKEGLRSRTEVLCERIRAGDADQGSWRRAVIDHVRQTVTEKLAVANPKFLGD